MSKTPLLEIEDLSARVCDKEIIKGFNLIINEGEVHALMGPNGAGKSTLSNVLCGKAGYEVTSGSVRFKGKDLLSLSPEDRASIRWKFPACRRRLFLNTRSMPSANIIICRSLTPWSLLRWCGRKAANWALMPR